jgi:hypothetical protein
MNKNFGPALRIKPFLFEDHVVVVLLAVLLGQRHDFQETGTLEGSYNVLKSKHFKTV